MRSRESFPFIAVLAFAAVLMATACGAPPAPATPEPTATPLPATLPSAPVQNLNFERLSVEDGLSHSTVNCILQDRKGFLWFGTEDGLSKYDGYSFTVYRHEPDDPHSLSHNVIWSLFEDASGTLWVGTFGGGLNRFDPDTGSFSRYDASDFQNLTDEPEEFRNVVWAIDEHPAGVLWIATYGGGLVRFDVESETFTSYAPDPADPDLAGHEWITAMVVDDAGNLWIGTDKEGLDRFDPVTKEFTTYRHDPDDPDSLGHDWITEVIQDRSGQIWIGTNGRGLDRFDPRTGVFAHYRHDPDDAQSMGDSLADNYIWSILEAPSGVLWIGTYGSGVYALVPPGSGGAESNDPAGFGQEVESSIHFRHDPTASNTLSSDRIRSVYRDRAGILWVGTQGGGVSKSDLASGRFAHFRGDPDDPRSLSAYEVHRIYQDQDGTLWIGTAGAGLDAFDRKTGRWRHYRYDPEDPGSLGNNTVYAIHQDSAGILWIGTADGFYRFDPKSERFERLAHYPPDPGDVERETIYSITEDSEDVLWLGTHGRGLSEFDPATGSFVYHLQEWGTAIDAGRRQSIVNNYIHDVAEDASGGLWVGTQEGLNYYARQTGQWLSFQHDPNEPNSLGHNWIMALDLDPSGILWIGTLGGGLDKFAPATGTFTHYRAKDGLASDVVLDVLRAPSPGNGSHLWIATANGLTRFDPRTETFKSYDASDGLPVNEFSAAYESEGGELFFGGIDGLISFRPDQMKDNPYVPPVVLTSLQQNGVEVDTGRAPSDLREVTFRWPDNSFEFGFAALNYNRPEKNQHAYMLDGFDQDWNEIGNQRFGRYTNLPGGTYVLQLIGSNNDGVWNTEGTSIRVTVIPPFWQTGWFWGIVGLALAGGAFGGYRLRVRSLEARSQELERQVEDRTAELQREIDQRIQAEEALRQREREKAIAEERNRLARDLHDAVTQSLYGVTLYSEAAAGQLSLGHTDRAAEHLHEVQDTAQEALAEMRLLVFELRPPILEEEGLVAALQTRLQAVEGRAGLRTEFKTNLDERLPPDVEGELYRIAQEALNNALKHAGASTIRLLLHQDSENVVLEIADDGAGFDQVAAREGGGLGLLAMQERTAELGGQMTIETGAASGTHITITWRKPQ